jgi:hypothetical protein
MNIKPFILFEKNPTFGVGFMVHKTSVGQGSPAIEVVLTILWFELSFGLKNVT